MGAFFIIMLPLPLLMLRICLVDRVATLFFWNDVMMRGQSKAFFVLNFVCALYGERA